MKEGIQVKYVYIPVLFANKILLCFDLLSLPLSLFFLASKSYLIQLRQSAEDHTVLPVEARKISVNNQLHKILHSPLILLQ